MALPCTVRPDAAARIARCCRNTVKDPRTWLYTTLRPRKSCVTSLFTLILRCRAPVVPKHVLLTLSKPNVATTHTHTHAHIQTTTHTISPRGAMSDSAKTDVPSWPSDHAPPRHRGARLGCCLLLDCRQPAQLLIMFAADSRNRAASDNDISNSCSD